MNTTINFCVTKSGWQLKHDNHEPLEIAGVSGRGDADDLCADSKFVHPVQSPELHAMNEELNLDLLDEERPLTMPLDFLQPVEVSFGPFHQGTAFDTARGGVLECTPCTETSERCMGYSKNLIAERKRRKKLTESLLTLRGLVPNITKVRLQGHAVDMYSSFLFHYVIGDKLTRFSRCCSLFLAETCEETHVAST